MEARERILGLQTMDCTSGLIYPVVFADSENFPPETRARQARDLKQWNVPDMIYKETADYVEFGKQMRIVAGDLATMIRRVPQWQPEWPVHRPLSPIPPPTPVPRINAP
jgi:hypothetical protein